MGVGHDASERHARLRGAPVGAGARRARRRRAADRPRAAALGGRGGRRSAGRRPRAARSAADHGRRLGQHEPGRDDHAGLRRRGAHLDPRRRCPRAVASRRGTWSASWTPHPWCRSASSRRSRSTAPRPPWSRRARASRSSRARTPATWRAPSRRSSLRGAGRRDVRRRRARLRARGRAPGRRPGARGGPALAATSSQWSERLAERGFLTSTELEADRIAASRASGLPGAVRARPGAARALPHAAP